MIQGIHELSQWLAIPGRIWQRESLTVVAKGTGSLGFAADGIEIW